MKRKLYMDELESFLAESADDVRMYPSDKVWSRIDRQLHSKRRWPALNFTAFVAGTIVLVAFWLFRPEKEPFAAQRQAENKVASSIYEPSTGFQVANLPLAEKVSTVAPSLESMPLQPEQNIEDGYPAGIANTQPVHIISANNITDESGMNSQAKDVAGNMNADHAGLNESGTSSLSQTLQGNFFQASLSNELPLTTQHGLVNLQETNIASAYNWPSVSTAIAEETTSKNILPGIKSNKNRWSIQYYAAPSFSYRLLNEVTDQKISIPGSGLVSANTYNQVADAVSHRKDFGIEAGASVAYAVTEKLRVKAGLQFNYRSFNIDATQLGTPQPVTLRFLSGFGQDSLQTMATMANNAGVQTTTLQNRFYQISLPIGFDLSVAQWGKTSLNLGTTLQPTLNLRQDGWQLSTDYQHYVQESSLLRSFNLNSSIEAFLRFPTKGSLEWQVGPQIRYQLLSTTHTFYPIREHLIDYGVKIGVTKTLH